MIVADQQIVAAAAATLTATIVDSTGEPDDTIGGVTVTITRADGTALVTAAAATDAGTGIWSYALTAAQTAALDILTATWTASGTVRATTVHEIVGGVYFTAAEAIAAEPTLSTWTTGQIHGMRRDVEEELEQITGVAWVPRYSRHRLDGTGRTSIDLRRWAPRTLRSARVYDDDTTYTAFTAGELAAVDLAANGIGIRTDGSAWTAGRANIVVELDHGHDRPPNDLKRMAVRRLRQRLNLAQSAIPDRAISFAVAEGGTFRLATPGRDRTGDPEIDAVLARYTVRVPAIA